MVLDFWIVRVTLPENWSKIDSLQKAAANGGGAYKGSHPKLSPDEEPGSELTLVRKSDVDRRFLATQIILSSAKAQLQKGPN